MSATTPIELAIRAEHANDFDLAISGREREIALTEAQDWLRRNPEVLAERIAAERDNETLFELCQIFLDTRIETREKAARARAVIERELDRFAEIEARNI